jgi:cytochrome c biogenesis protein CcmG, thiol:disulfide interchange protein DsbE
MNRGTLCLVFAVALLGLASDLAAVTNQAPRLAGVRPPPTLEPAPGAELMGRSLPALRLELVDGSQLDVEPFSRSNRVIVLHFWASWAPQSRRSLPLLATLAGEYAGRGVLFCVVNVRETVGEVRRRAGELGAGLSVATDPGGDVARRCGVAGVPLTMVVGRDGRVCWVRPGFDGTFQAELSAELDLLAPARPESGRAFQDR